LSSMSFLTASRRTVLMLLASPFVARVVPVP
jgi:hypothetical protein